MCFPPQISKISKEVMDLHGGLISMYSKGVGFGCTFTLKLPLYPASYSNHELPVNTNESIPVELTSHRVVAVLNRSTSREAVSNLVDPPTNTLRRRRSSNTIHNIQNIPIKPTLRFLVVDDSPLSRKMLVRLLKDDKHICEQANDGDEAVKLIKAAAENLRSESCDSDTQYVSSDYNL